MQRMTCSIQSWLDQANETNADSGKKTYQIKDGERAVKIVGMKEASVEQLEELRKVAETQNSEESAFREQLLYTVQNDLPELISHNAAALPQSTGEALTRKLLLGPVFTPGNLQHGVSMQSWTNLAGGTGGAFGETTELSASALTHKTRNYLTWNWQDGFKDGMLALIKSKGGLNWEKYLAIHDQTAFGREVWRELILNGNQKAIGKEVEWSSPEMQKLGEHLSKTYDQMYAELEQVGGVTDTRRNAPIRFKDNLQEVIDRMGYSEVMEAIRRGGNPNPDAAYQALAYGPTAGKGMQILGKALSGHIDLNYKSNGVSLMDAVDLDGWHGVSRDISRVSGVSSLKQVSQGLIDSPEKWASTLRLVGEELLHNGTSKADTVKQLQLLQDTYDSITGNPVRGGLAPELRMLWSAAAQTLLGSAGIAQMGAITLGAASKVAAMMTGRGGLELKHLLVNTGRYTPLTQELESLVTVNKGIHNLVPVVRINELELGIKYGILRTIGQTIIRGATLADFHGSMSRALMTANLMTTVSKYASRFLTTQTLNDVARYYKNLPTSMEHKRGVTAGFWEPDGPNPLLAEIFSKMSYTPEGNVKSLNLGTMSRTEQAYLSALMTKELTRITGEVRVAGEFPSWMNNLVAHSLLQFKDIGIKLASSNTLAGMRYGDIDTVFEHLTAAGISSFLMYGKDTVGDFINPPKEKGKESPYDAFFRSTLRMNELMAPFSDLRNAYSIYDGAGHNKHLADTLLEEAPIIGVMNQWRHLLTGSNTRERLEAGLKLIPGNNTLLLDDIMREHVTPALAKDLDSYNSWESTHYTAQFKATGRR
jgi:hypothetical protein